MSRRRYVSTDVSIDKRLNRLATEHGDFAALLYSWMIPHATDEATLNGDLDEFMATVLPMRRDKTPAEVRTALEAMVSVGLLTAWDGETIYFPTEAFYRYQTYIKVENRRIGDVTMGERTSPPNADEQRETPTNSEGKGNEGGLDSTAENAEERRSTAENAVSSSLSPSVSSSLPLPLSSPAQAPAASAAPRKKPALVPLTEAERGELLAKWRARIPEAEDQIALALEHEAHLKYPTGQKRYVDNWLRNHAERSNGNGRTAKGGLLQGRTTRPDEIVGAWEAYVAARNA